MQAYDSDPEEGDDGKELHSIKSRKRKGLEVDHEKFSESEELELQSIGRYLGINARGVILWVTLVLTDLQTQLISGLSTFTELRTRLVILPLKLNDLYQHIVQELQERLGRTTSEKQKVH
jgi:hypothetical protein